MEEIFIVTIDFQFAWVIYCSQAWPEATALWLHPYCHSSRPVRFFELNLTVQYPPDYPQSLLAYELRLQPLPPYRHLLCSNCSMVWGVSALKSWISLSAIVILFMILFIKPCSSHTASLPPTSSSWVLTFPAKPPNHCCNRASSLSGLYSL